MTAKLHPLITLLAAALLSVGHALDGLWAWAMCAAGLGLLWLLAQQRTWRASATLGLIGMVAIAALGLWRGVGSGWMLAGSVAALAAWDLAQFNRRLRTVAYDEATRALERRHLLRLGLTCGLGLILAATALAVYVELNFGLAFLLALLAVAGLSQLVRLLRRTGD